MELAKLGDIEALERQLESLTTLDYEYTPFTRQTGQLAAGFQQHELINFIEQFL
ncbi:hypothetical protein [Myxosarcina sp. GI1(2024)]